MTSNWPPRDWLKFSIRHHRFHGHHNLGFAALWCVVGVVTGVWIYAVPAVVFVVAGVDHLRDAKRAQQKLRSLYP